MSGNFKASSRKPERSAVTKDGYPESQPSVFTEDKEHALFLWITLKEPKLPQVIEQVFEVAASLQNIVDDLHDLDPKNKHDKILAGVGFGPEFWCKVGGETNESFEYKSREWKDINMPKSDGDVFVHAKSNRIGQLFDLARHFTGRLPPGSFDFEDIYGFVYRKSQDFHNGTKRDLSGFIDGIANPKKESRRREVAVVKETGGSYAITTKWIHDWKSIDTTEVNILEAWIGRRLDNGKELTDKPITAHIVRMRFGEENKWQIVRQAMPFGTVSGTSGLFFIAYAASPENFERMLDNMVDGENSDDLFKMSKNVQGSYWYFPGVKELENTSKK